MRPKFEFNDLISIAFHGFDCFRLLILLHKANKKAYVSSLPGISALAIFLPFHLRATLERRP
jgi:hypothetical protein